MFFFVNLIADIHFLQGDCLGGFQTLIAMETHDQSRLGPVTRSRKQAHANGDFTVPASGASNGELTYMNTAKFFSTALLALGLTFSMNAAKADDLEKIQKAGKM